MLKRHIEPLFSLSKVFILCRNPLLDPMLACDAHEMAPKAAVMFLCECICTEDSSKSKTVLIGQSSQRPPSLAVMYFYVTARKWVWVKFISVCLLLFWLWFSFSRD